MKLCIKICLISCVIMFSVIGGYSLLLSPIDKQTKAANADVDDSDVTKIITEEKRNFIASVCDAVCPNAPYLVKVVFCSVILNRCNNDAFPNTASEVVFNDPMFAVAFERDYAIKASDVALRACDDAVSGFSPCPDALYFYTTNGADFTLRKRRTLFQIGKYVFS